MTTADDIRNSRKPATLAHLNDAFSTPIDELIEADLERYRSNPEKIARGT